MREGNREIERRVRKEPAAGGRMQLGYISGRDWGFGGGGILGD